MSIGIVTYYNAINEGAFLQAYCLKNFIESCSTSKVYFVPNKSADIFSMFAGFLYCGDCGSRLVRRSASYKEKRYIYYQCSGSKQNKGSCTSHNLRDEKLYNIVRNALQMQIQIVMEEAEFAESIRQAQQEPYRVRRIERQIRQLTAEKAHTQGIKEKLYGDYLPIAGRSFYLCQRWV